MRVLGISGSLRRDSYNTKLLRHAGELFASEGVEFEIYEGLEDVPPYDEDDDMEGAPEAVSRIRGAVGAADAVFSTTPEYNSSISGAQKNALDWVSRPAATSAMRTKSVAVIGASDGMFGAVWAQAELRKVLGAVGARVAEGEVAVGRAMDRFDANGRPSEPNLEEEVARSRGHADRRSQGVCGPRPARRLTRPGRSVTRHDSQRLHPHVHYTRLDGGGVTVPCCNVFRLRDDLVAEYRSYIDATPVYS